MEIEEFITKRTQIISEMLDNPDQHGIYGTGNCFKQLDNLFEDVTKSKWIKAKEQQPTDGSHYLVWFGGEYMVAQWSEGRWIEQWRINISANDITDEVEYWMPLPEPPKQ